MRLHAVEVSFEHDFTFVHDENPVCVSSREKFRKGNSGRFTILDSFEGKRVEVNWFVTPLSNCGRAPGDYNGRKYGAGVLERPNIVFRHQPISFGDGLVFFFCLADPCKGKRQQKRNEDQHVRVFFIGTLNSTGQLREQLVKRSEMYLAEKK